MGNLQVQARYNWVHCSLKVGLGKVCLDLHILGDLPELPSSCEAQPGQGEGGLLYQAERWVRSIPEVVGTAGPVREGRPGTDLQAEDHEDRKDRSLVLRSQAAGSGNLRGSRGRKEEHLGLVVPCTCEAGVPC